MKKTFLALIVFLFASQLQAQDTLLLSRIMEAGNQLTSLSAQLHNHNKKGEKITEKDGKISYAAPDKLAAIFENDTYLIINENYIKVDIGIFHGTFRMRNGILRSLSRAFLYAIQGRCQDLADENNYSLQTETDEQFHNVTLTTKKKLLIGIGIKQAILRYGVNDLLIKEIVLIEYRGYIDTYTLVNEKYNKEIKESDFEI